MSPAFAAKKAKILQQLTAPKAPYTDTLPKSSVDVGIRKLVDEINEIDTLATTSSCAGRIAVYLEGREQNSPRPTPDDDAHISDVAAAGVESGGQSLFVSHDPLPLSGKGPVAPMLGLSDHTNLGVPSSVKGVRWVRCKFEPMVVTNINPELIDEPDLTCFVFLA
ncbi:hypothetical protein E4T38_05346 [Aureobasidium subglaciale]|nr:hypothetical protein E4T38_05346 [Aureobasidium subglaciale]KAI5221779.1 hypothetical protein E4T40_05279 [Aureobasidium subglaciale]KAI5225787.1 hypothetical protein E4T41_05098 [Aureobasidium subglaciale]KAI5261653.1 hypothetical protein E4T46_04991 [Aureobasidium subglaciale]